jgi:hypothetical protein
MLFRRSDIDQDETLLWAPWSTRHATAGL